MNDMQLSRRTTLKGMAAVMAAGLVNWGPMPHAWAQEFTVADDAAAERIPLRPGQETPVGDAAALGGESATLLFRYQAEPGSTGPIVQARAGGSAVFGVAIDRGHLEFGEQLRFPVASDRPAHLDDGHPHWVALVVDPQGTRVFLDGQYAHSTTRTYSERAQAATVMAGGGNVTGWVSDVVCTDRALSPEEISRMCTLPVPVGSWQGPFDVAPRVPLVNRLPDLGEQLPTEGTLFVEFTTVDRGVVSLMSVGDSRADATDLTLALNDGALVVEHRTRGRFAMKFTVAGDWADGERHSVAMSTSPHGSIVYVDGSEVERHSHSSFIAGLGGATGLWLGGNTDNHGEEWKLTGTIHRAAVFQQPLLWQQVAQLAEQPIAVSRALFDRGYGGSASYRIPTLLRTQAGTLLACADQRTASPYDSPNHIQTAVRRSEDGGHTWEDVQVAITQPGSGRSGASVIDTCLVQDRDSGRIIMIVDRFPGGGGQANSRATTGYDAQGRKLLTDTKGTVYTLQADGTVDGTDFIVDTDGTIRRDGVEVGNIHLPGGPLSEERTAYMVMVSSMDDGRTWSEPVDITHQVKQPWMRFLGTGPGSALQTTSGRMLVPVYFNNARSSANVYSAGVIFSDDGGINWNLGGSPNGDLDLETFNDRRRAAHEATIAQTADGTIHMFMRNLGPHVLHSTSDDDGDTWTVPVALTQVPEIFSQPNVLAIGGNQLVFSNASKRFPGDSGRSRERGRGVLRYSDDGGRTFSRNRVFRPDTYVYSSMVLLDDSTIGLLWEMEWDGIYFAHVPIDWILAGRMA
ncbi:hypothetical protein C1Y63_02685 [Corynebacterium sp. 13CS0277]|uniref:sialidase family protein n=1 Tax=Corynebacterium sp. 13CS0277 TaxID=2071994 RepID=UPI000D03E011|nr:sialidase family protein [Corynebacterium sp. 13CS0277]PRQ12233.1 hypothetical protein C1Y63_02685 [Corynebacterium sp. 13CS0277]